KQQTPFAAERVEQIAGRPHREKISADRDHARGVEHDLPGYEELRLPTLQTLQCDDDQDCERRDREAASFPEDGQHAAEHARLRIDENVLDEQPAETEAQEPYAIAMRLRRVPEQLLHRKKPGEAHAEHRQIDDLSGS